MPAVSHFQVRRLQTVHSAGPRTLAANRSVYALWPLATGYHKIDCYHDKAEGLNSIAVHPFKGATFRHVRLARGMWSRAAIWTIVMHAAMSDGDCIKSGLKKLWSDVIAGPSGMVVGEDLRRFLSQKTIGKRLSAHSGLRNRYEETCRIEKAHSVRPVVLREEGYSAERVYELMRKSETGYVYLEYPASVQVDALDESSAIGDTFGVQSINPEGAQSCWLDSESADRVTVADVRETGRELDALLYTLFEQVQAAWGGVVNFASFVEALRHEMHNLSASRLHTAYFHSIDLSGRPDGPTLVKGQTSR